MARIQERDRKSKEGVNNYLTEQTDSKTEKGRWRGSSVLRGDVEGEDEVFREEQSRGGLKKNTEMK